MSLEFNCVLFIDLFYYLSQHQTSAKVLVLSQKVMSVVVATLCTHETTDRKDPVSTSSGAAVLFSPQN